MIKYMDNLTTYDKLFMLYNKSCFSMSTRSSINYNRAEWNTVVEREFTKDEIKEVEEMESNTKKKILDCVSPLSNKGTINIKDVIDELMNNITLETSESIVDFIIYCRNHLKTWHKGKKILPDDIHAFYKMLYEIYIPYKIKANSIYKKTSSDVRAMDEALNDFMVNINKILFHQISLVHEPNTSAMIIYQIMSNLGCDDKNENVLEFFLLGKKFFSGEDVSKIKPLVIKLLNGKADALNVIDSISNVEFGETIEKLIDFSKRNIENNYIKSKISEEVRGNTLCIGEDIFPDHEPMRVDNLLVELDRLSEDEIKNYIGKEKMISYGLTENEIGYLKKGEKLPICKIMRKNDMFYTITKINNESYLLFKVYGYKQIFGISFPPSNGGRRKLMKLLPPANVEYTMVV